MSESWVSEDDLPDAGTAAGLDAPDVDYSAIGAVCHQDPESMRRLRASLAVIARRTEDPGLRQLVVAVLRGSVSVRRVFEHPGFQAMSSHSTDNLSEGLARLDDDTREELMSRVGANDTSEATEFALMQDQPVLPRTERRAD